MTQIMKELLFSSIVAQRTKEHYHLQVGTEKSIIQLKFNFKFTCSELFHEYIYEKLELLKVKKSEKYIKIENN